MELDATLLAVVGYIPYEGLNLTNQISRKLGVFDRKLEKRCKLFYHYFDLYWKTEALF